jgi:hypothetical protein
MADGTTQSKGFTIVRGVVGLYLSLLLLELIAVGAWMTRSNRDWGLPEWLINYQGGFIRRGLPGTILRSVSHVTHVPAIYMAAAIGIVCYVIIYAETWKLLSLSRWRWWTIALVVCPGTLAFPVISRTSFRKDILYFALLAMLIEWLRRQPAEGPTAGRNDLRLMLILNVVLPALVLSQEPVFVYFPYLLAVMLLCMRPWSRVLRVCLLPGLLATVAFVAVSTHTGTYGQMQAICASIGKPVVETCPQGIQINGLPHQSVPQFVRAFHYLRHYPLDFLLCLLPVYGAWRTFREDEGTRRKFKILLATAGLAAVGSAGVFAVGLDWGRWINLHAISLMLLVLLIESQRTAQVSTAEVAAKWPGLRFATIVFLLVYATCWSMPGTKDKPLFGYITMANRLIHWNGSFTS